MASKFSNKPLSANTGYTSSTDFEKFYATYDRLPDGFASCNDRYETLFCNKALRDMMPASAHGKCSNLFDILEAITGKKHKNEINSAMLQQQCTVVDLQQADNKHHFQIWLMPSSNGLLMQVRKQTPQMQQSLQLTANKRYFDLLTAMNDLALQETDEEQLFQKACDIAVKIGGFKLAWLGIANDQGTAILPTYYTGEISYLENIRNMPLDQSLLSQGPTGMAFKTGTVFYSNDIMSDPFMQPWRYLAAELGFGSLVSLPLKMDGRVKAIWSLYAEKPNWFNEHELELLKRTAANLSFARTFQRHRRQQASTAEQLRIVNRAFEQSSSSIVITNVEGTIEYVNPAFCQLTGYSEAEALGQNLRILKSGVTTEDEFKRMWQTLTSKKPWQGEFCNKKKNGEAYWELASITPILNDDGDITHYLAVKDNITERKALEEAQQRLLDIIDNTTTYVLIVDVNQRLIFANRAFRKMNGIAFDEDITRYTVSDIQLELDTKISQEIAEQVQKNGIWEGENYFVNKLGERTTVWQVVLAHRNALGITTHTSITAVDITPLKEAQLETMLLTDELRALSNHLQQTRETEKREIASQLHDQLGQLVAAIKIDAAWIQRHLQETDDEVLKVRMQRMLDNIEETSKSFSKVHATLQPAMLEELGLISAIEWMIDHVLPRGTVQLHFTTNLTDNDKLPASIALAIHRATQECLSNIAKHANAGRVLVDLQKNKQHIVLNIEDDGIGFDADNIDTRSKHGLLGLRERLFAINGQLLIHSMPGAKAGTQVEIIIPL